MSSSLVSESAGVTILLDAVLDEAWDEPVAVTEHPVDRRSPVTDHIQALQRKLTLRVQVSGAVTERLRLLYPKVGPARYLGIRDLLREYRGTTFRYVSTRTGEINRLVLKGLRYAIDPRERVIFTLDFVQISFAETEVGKLPAIPRKRRDPDPVVNGSAGFSAVPKGAPLFESRTRAFGDLLARAFPGN